MSNTTDQLKWMRLLQQSQASTAPNITFTPVQNVGQGIGQGVNNLVNIAMQRQAQIRNLQLVAQQQQMLQQSEAQARAEKVSTYQGLGMSPMEAMAAAQDEAMARQIQQQQYDYKKLMDEQDEKQMRHSTLQSAFLAQPGMDANNPQHVAQAILYADQAEKGTPFGQDTMSHLFNGRVMNSVARAQIPGGLNALDDPKSVVGPGLRLSLHNFGIDDVPDGVSEIQRQATANKTATDAQWQPYIHQANVTNTNTRTVGQGIDNEKNNIGLGIMSDQHNLGKKYLNGEIDAGQLMRLSLGLSLSPIEQLSRITGNKNLYGSNDSLIPNAAALSIPSVQNNVVSPHADPGYELDLGQLGSIVNNSSLGNALQGAGSDLVNYSKMSPVEQMGRAKEMRNKLGKTLLGGAQKDYVAARKLRSDVTNAITSPIQQGIQAAGNLFGIQDNPIYKTVMGGGVGAVPGMAPMRPAMIPHSPMSTMQSSAHPTQPKQAPVPSAGQPNPALNPLQLHLKLKNSMTNGATQIFNKAKRQQQQFIR